MSPVIRRCCCLNISTTLLVRATLSAPLMPSQTCLILLRFASGRDLLPRSAWLSPRGLMLRVYLYGYLNHGQPSRRLEHECGRNLELICLRGRFKGRECQGEELRTRQAAPEVLSDACELVFTSPLPALSHLRLTVPVLCPGFRQKQERLGNEPY